MKKIKYISIALMSILIQQYTLATGKNYRLNTSTLKSIEEVIEPAVNDISLENKTGTKSTLSLDSLKNIQEEETENIVEDLKFSKEEITKYSYENHRLPLHGLIEIRAEESLQELY